MFYLYLFAFIVIFFVIYHFFRNHNFSLSKKINKAKEVGNIRYVAWNGKYSWDAVGESFYQLQLSSIAGPKEVESKNYNCNAMLIRNPENKHDSNAIMVVIEGKQVGHISRARAASFVREMKKLGLSTDTIFIVKARINGGWRDSYGDGNYGVVFDFPPVNRIAVVLSANSMEDSELLFKNRLKKN